MQVRTLWLAALGAAVLALTAHAAAPDTDPYLWLSDIHGAKALAWVAQQNAKSEAVITQDPAFATTRASILKALDTKDRIPLGDLDHGAVYNFWQDGDHVRGLWRRVSVRQGR